MRLRRLVSAVALVCAATSSGAGTEERAPFPCLARAGEAHAVVRVLDSETLLLDDGQEVRLIGALGPKPESLRIAAEDWPPERDARRALSTLVEGRTVELSYETRRRDRYGRILAHVLVRAPEGAQWLQERLVSSGHARAYALPGHDVCVRELMRAEGAAREARLGLWQQPIYGIESAENTEALLRRAGRFVVVEGLVANVAHSARETFINFGSDWRRDFTASLPIKVADETPGARERLSALAGRHVRVRGWIERRNGPMIHLSSLAEIEELDQASPAPP